MAERYPLGKVVTVGVSDDEWPAKVVGYEGQSLIVQSLTGIPEQDIAPGQAWVVYPLYILADDYTGDKPL